MSKESPRLRATYDTRHSQDSMLGLLGIAGRADLWDMVAAADDQTVAGWEQKAEFTNQWMPWLDNMLELAYRAGIAHVVGAVNGAIIDAQYGEPRKADLYNRRKDNRENVECPK